MDILEEEQYCHIVLRDILEKYQYLEKRDRAFISRVTEGTVENMIRIDYILEQFSSVKIKNMKPFIRNLLRMSVYQMEYMDSVPDSAVCNEAVKLAQKKGFYTLKGLFFQIRKKRRADIYPCSIRCRNGFSANGWRSLIFLLCRGSVSSSKKKAVPVSAVI